MNKSLKIFYVILMFVMALCFLVILYTLSYRLDPFPWGSSQHDGLFMIVIPIWILPIVYILSFIRWLMTRRYDSSEFSKITNIIYTIGTTLISLLVLFDLQFLCWICFILSTLLVMLVGKDIWSFKRMESI